MKALLIIILLVLSWSCVEKELDPNDAKKSFLISKEPFDDGYYETALTKLGEFKSRFPYSQYAIEAELLLADAHYKIKQYAEAAVSYSQFVKLHPKHVKVPYALYRVGESYWSDAPEAIDREQELTTQAITEWQKLLAKFPESDYSKQAQDNIKAGHERISKSIEFIINFYCKLDIYHACLFRAEQLSRLYPDHTESYEKLKILMVQSLEHIIVEKAKEPNSESPKNIYLRDFSLEELHNWLRRLKG